MREREKVSERERGREKEMNARAALVGAAPCTLCPFAHDPWPNEFAKNCKSISFYNFQRDMKNE